MKRFTWIEAKAASVKDDVLSGFTVAIALVPEAVAFAFIAGVSPVVGLYGAFMMGLITSIIGGRPGMISGATGATAIVMVSLVKIGTDMGGAIITSQKFENDLMLFRKDFGGVLGSKNAWPILVYGLSTLIERGRKQHTYIHRINQILDTARKLL